jgi:phosphatidylserine decarboxylase
MHPSGKRIGDCAARRAGLEERQKSFIILSKVCMSASDRNFTPGTNAPGGSAKWRWPAIHPEGRPFILIAVAITLAFAWMAWETLAWPMAAITIRDPVRVTPTDPRAIIAPADGLITMITQAAPPPELQGADALGTEPVTRVSIFMNVFDVHINRAPIDGTVTHRHYIAGLFVNADLDKASEDNERQHFLIERNDGVKVGFTQIAGLVARRIVAHAKPGDVVTAGQRVGLIRFGSRVDVYLPAGTMPRVLSGQRTVAGETIIAELGDAALRAGIAG